MVSTWRWRSNWTRCNLRLFPLVLSACYFGEEADSHLTTAYFQVLKGSSSISIWFRIETYQPLNTRPMKPGPSLQHEVYGSHQIDPKNVVILSQLIQIHLSHDKKCSQNRPAVQKINSSDVYLEPPSKYRNFNELPAIDNIPGWDSLQLDLY
ncbi:hypothetical protein BTVI_149219 [Pitangus sulphuratus]|nr:hypothetical protein BTVI_149219 [Pitangus sulphuratus]